LAGDQTVAEIASKHSLISKSIQNWKKVFLANASSNSKYAWSKDHSNKSQWIMAQAANVLKTVVP